MDEMSLSSKWTKEAKKSKTSSIPENWDSIESEPAKPKDGEKLDWRVCAGAGDWEGGRTLIAAEITRNDHGFSTGSRVWFEVDYREFPKGADNDQPKEVLEKVAARGKAASDAFIKAARAIQKRHEKEDAPDIQWDWASVFREALSDSSVKPFVKASGTDRLKWVPEDAKD